MLDVVAPPPDEDVFADLLGVIGSECIHGLSLVVKMPGSVFDQARSVGTSVTANESVPRYLHADSGWASPTRNAAGRVVVPRIEPPAGRHTQPNPPLQNHALSAKASKVIVRQPLMRTALELWRRSSISTRIIAAPPAAWMIWS